MRFNHLPKSLLILASFVSIPGYTQSLFRIAYLPFSVQTYAPVTTQNIERNAYLTISVRNQSIPKAVISLINNESTNKMDPKSIRLLVTQDQTKYIFDRYGHGLRNGKQPVCISTKEFEKLITEDRINLPLNPFPEAP